MSGTPAPKLAHDVRVVDSLDGLDALAPEWQALADAHGAGPSVQPWFTSAWWRHLGRGSLHVVVARDSSGRLVGVAPMHERRVPGLRILRWTGQGLGAVSEVLGATGEPDDPIARAVWSHVAEERGRLLQLVQHRLGGGGLGVLRSGEIWRSDVVVTDTCPVIDLGGVADADELLAQRGFRKLRQNLARLDRHVQGSGADVDVQIHTTADELAVLLPDLQVVHDRAEEAHPRLHFLREPFEAFTVDALQQIARNGQMALAVVRVDGRAVGFHVAVRAGRTVAAWLARFDPSAAEFAPGHLMLRAVVDWSAKAGAERIDMQLGGDAYKMRWSTSSYDTVAVAASRRSSRLPARTAIDAVDLAYRLRARVR